MDEVERAVAKQLAENERFWALVGHRWDSDIGKGHDTIPITSKKMICRVCGKTYKSGVHTRSRYCPKCKWQKNQHDQATGNMGGRI